MMNINVSDVPMRGIGLAYARDTGGIRWSRFGRRTFRLDMTTAADQFRLASRIGAMD
jgi:hypothetical protein